MRRTSRLAAAVLLAGTALAACSEPAPEGPATYPEKPRPVQVGEVPVDNGTAEDGKLRFTVIGYQASVLEIIGSHAEFFPKGRYVAVRIVLENVDRTDRTFDVYQQRLLLADGTAVAPDYDAESIKRQVKKTLIGPSVRMEFDIWFDVPADAVPTAIRFSGDPATGGPKAETKLPAAPK